MGSIPKIVLTPLKWASKKIINRTLLRFPGEDQQTPIACVYCPEMCRFSCPTAVVSGNDAVTPCNKMGLLYKEEKWPGSLSKESELWPIYDCTGCGRCTEYCVYEMPVTQKLFAARKTFKWDRAQEVATEITDELDRVGDLADELGDQGNAKRRMEKFIQSLSTPPLSEGTTQPVSIQVNEPKSCFYLNQNGYPATLKWEDQLKTEGVPSEVIQKLESKTWLVHESGWHSRHLKSSEVIHSWFESLRQAGVKVERPFAHGRDCIDCGGEGAYSRLFPEQADQMAREIWERDQHRAQGILCISQRCAQHFRKVMGAKVPVLAIQELYSL